MSKNRTMACLAMVAGAMLGGVMTGSVRAESIPVTIEADGQGGWQLRRGGEPFFIKGAGGHRRIDELAKAGGNSIRTWGLDGTREVLDEAHKHGVAVTMGLWMAHPRHGFDYNNAEAVAKQKEALLEQVRLHKDHPAVLMWGIGNEVELMAEGDQTPMWRAINDLALAVKELSPAHPTMAVVAEVSPEKVRAIREHAPAIDVLGVNSYGGGATAADRARRFGWEGPVVITEYGPRGHWENFAAPWGAPVEPNSTVKAGMYDAVYRTGIAGKPHVVGSYAFLWGHKQETTHTWFGVFLPTGERLGAVDALTRAWSGREPENRAPEIRDFYLGAALRTVRPEAEVWAQVLAVDADGDPLTVRWEIREETRDRRAGGDAEAVPEVREILVLQDENGFLRFRAPDHKGTFRMFVYVTDGKGNAATANLPFAVDPEARGR